MCQGPWVLTWNLKPSNIILLLIMWIILRFNRVRCQLCVQYSKLWDRQGETNTMFSSNGKIAFPILDNSPQPLKMISTGATHASKNFLRNIWKFTCAFNWPHLRQILSDTLIVSLQPLAGLAHCSLFQTKSSNFFNTILLETIGNRQLGVTPFPNWHANHTSVSTDAAYEEENKTNNLVQQQSRKKRYPAWISMHSTFNYFLRSQDLFHQFEVNMCTKIE